MRSGYFRDNVIKHLDRRLKRNLIIYYMIIILVLLINIHEIIIGSIHIIVSVLSMTCGFFLGIISHRVVNITWHADERKVVGRMDRIGITIIIVYTIFAICRYLLLDYYFRSSIVVAVTLAVYCGITLGRVVGMRRRILTVLKQQQIVD